MRSGEADKKDITEEATKRLLQRKKEKIPGHLTIYVDKDGNAPAWDEYIKH